MRVLGSGSIVRLVRVVLELVQLEPVALAVDLLRPAVGRPALALAERAHEEAQLEPERDEEHGQDRNRVPQLARPEDPHEHEQRQRDVHHDRRAHVPTVAGTC